MGRDLVQWELGEEYGRSVCGYYWIFKSGSEYSLRFRAQDDQEWQEINAVSLVSDSELGNWPLRGIAREVALFHQRMLIAGSSHETACKAILEMSREYVAEKIGNAIATSVAAETPLSFAHGMSLIREGLRVLKLPTTTGHERKLLEDIRSLVAIHDVTVVHIARRAAEAGHAPV